MRKDITDLKKLTTELMNNPRPTEDWKEDNSQLLERIYNDEDSPSNENQKRKKPSPAEQKYLPIYSDERSSGRQQTYDTEHETVEQENLSLQEKELELIKKALDRNGEKRKDAARDLGISERTLYRKIKQYNL
jgi:transcriptional regulator with PAS, ATPase and Fis domain